VFVSWQTKNLSEHFIRHRNFLAEVSHVTSGSSELDKRDASFSIPDSFAVGETIRIRSENFPLHVLRHQNFRVKLHEYNPGLGVPPTETLEQQLLRRDTLFIVERGLADASGFSFRSENINGHYIRHRNFELFIDPRSDDELFRNDATFFMRRPAFFEPPPVPLH
jgi:Alpha-L-arabinofuranosidase B (ABFB) domain